MGDGFDPIDSRSVFAIVVLGHMMDCQQSGSFRLHQELLLAVNCQLVTVLTGLIDVLLHAQHMLLKRLPGQLMPGLTLRIRCLS